MISPHLKAALPEILTGTRISIVLLGIALFGLVAFFFDGPRRRVERRLLPWKGKA